MIPKCISLAQTCPVNSTFFHSQLPPGHLPLERLTIFKTPHLPDSHPKPALLIVFPPQLLTAFSSQSSIPKP